MERIATVSQINAYLKTLLDYDELVSDIWIKGEISNFKLHYSGHMYMSLKDSGGVMRAVMFRGANASLRFRPENGMSVLAHGRISLYERDGQYQLYISEMRPEGVGDLYVAYEQLREKLRLEGLFEQERKKNLPKYPRTVGVITSATGAAVRDIINVLSRRFISDIRVYPTLVQGAGAAQQIAAAIKYFNEHHAADVLIVGRGGGSIEDLWAFNEEITARAVASSEIPIISAVGHETDFTICDFVSDLRAPTPSAAAELAVPDINEVLAALQGTKAHMTQTILGKMNVLDARIDSLAKSTSPKFFLQRLQENMQHLDKMQSDLEHAALSKLAEYDKSLAALCAKLDALSPLKVLARGYAVATNADGAVLHSSTEAMTGDTINVRLHSGSLVCEVTEV